MTWSRRVAKLADALRHAPGTLIYLCCLLVTQLTLNTLDTPLGRRLVLGVSTNLHNMAESPVQVLIGSAFWTDTSPLLTGLTLVALPLVMVPVERWLGTGRWLVTLLVGHVGATLLTLLVTDYALRAGMLRPAIAHTADVGVSYGLFAAAGVLTYRFPRRFHRLGWALLMLSLLLVLALLLGSHQEIGDLGHLSAFGLGLAMRPLTRARRPALSPTGPGSGAPASPRSTDAVEVAPARQGEQREGAESDAAGQPAGQQSEDRVTEVELRHPDSEHDRNSQPAQ